MSIDLSILLSSNGASSTGTISPMAMYKKLQRVAEENRQKQEAAASEERAKEALREFNNATVRLRNKQYMMENARIESEAIYFQNRAATATTVEELINDDRFLRVLAYANGFGDVYEYNRQHLRDVLMSDLSDPNSAAMKGSPQELELAMRYNFAASGPLLDVNGNVVGVDGEGNLVNDGSHVAALPAGLAKLRGVVLDASGNAALDGNGKVVATARIATQDASQYTKTQQKTLLKEEAAPPPKSYYEYDSDEFQRFRQSRKVQAEIEYFRDNIKDITSLDDLFKNYRLFKFILSAFDLESEAQYPGKIRKIIESDMSDPDSLANRFQDPRFQELANAIAYKHVGVEKLKTPVMLEELATRFERLSYERYLDEQAPGVRAALEFERRLPKASKTVQVLADSVLREVITVANQLPKQIAYQDVDAQVTAVEKRFDLQSVKNDQAAIEKLVVRYLTFKSSESTGGPQSYLLNLFG